MLLQLLDFANCDAQKVTYEGKIFFEQLVGNYGKISQQFWQKDRIQSYIRNYCNWFNKLRIMIKNAIQCQLTQV